MVPDFQWMRIRNIQGFSWSPLQNGGQFLLLLGLFACNSRFEPSHNIQEFVASDEYDINPETGRRTRRTITFDESVTSERAAKAALQPYLDDYNARAKANLKPSAPRSAKTVGALLEEWTEKILPNRKLGGARAAQSHIRAYIRPLLCEVQLREMNLSQHQAFVTTVGRRVDRRKTAENVYGTLSSILNLGRKWGHVIPLVEKRDIVFPADKKPQP